MKRFLIIALAAGLGGAVIATQNQKSSASPMVQPGTDAPSFSLPDTTGKSRSLSDTKGKYVVLEWTNRGCPYVVRHYQGDMQRTQKAARDMGAVWYSLISSAPGKQGHMSAEMAAKHYQEIGGQADAVLFDSDGTVGKAYGARTTPQIVVIDPNGKVIYHGAIDDSPMTSADKTVTNYAIQALTEAKAGKTVSVPTSRPYGCGVKY